MTAAGLRRPYSGLSGAATALPFCPMRPVAETYEIEVKKGRRVVFSVIVRDPDVWSDEDTDWLLAVLKREGLTADLSVIKTQKALSLPLS